MLQGEILVFCRTFVLLRAYEYRLVRASCYNKKAKLEIFKRSFQELEQKYGIILPLIGEMNLDPFLNINDKTVVVVVVAIPLYRLLVGWILCLNQTLDLRRALINPLARASAN